jgi:hypothetical protein
MTDRLSRRGVRGDLLSHNVLDLAIQVLVIKRGCSEREALHQLLDAIDAAALGPAGIGTALLQLITAGSDAGTPLGRRQGDSQIG